MSESYQQFIDMSKASPEERSEYCLQQMLEQQALWGLFGEKGWLLLQAEEDACLPIWAHESCAKAWVRGDFPDCQPKQISLDDWQQQWLPGMAENGTLILVFPLAEDEEGIMLTAQELADSLQEIADEKSR